jgi:hypothetical protein
MYQYIRVCILTPFCKEKNMGRKKEKKEHTQKRENEYIMCLKF